MKPPSNLRGCNEQVVPRVDAESASRPTTRGKKARSVPVMRRMKKRILIYALFVGVLLIAVAGWTVQGARRLATA